jgi:hypothetical protein
MALLDRIDALLVLMHHSRSKSEQDAVLIRLQAEVNRLHGVIGESKVDGGLPANAHAPRRTGAKSMRAHGRVS